MSHVNKLIQQLGHVTSTEVIGVHGAFIYGDGYRVQDFFNYDGIHLNQRGSRSLVMSINNVVEIIKRRNYPRNEYNYSDKQSMQRPHLHATPLQYYGQTSPLKTHSHYNGRNNTTRYDSNMRTTYTEGFDFYCKNCMMRNHYTRDCRRQNRSTGHRLQTPTSIQYSGYENVYGTRQKNNTTKYRHYTDVDNRREK